MLNNIEFDKNVFKFSTTNHNIDFCSELMQWGGSPKQSFIGSIKSNLTLYMLWHAEACNLS